MSGYDPTDFQDLSDLIAFRQRTDQLDATESTQAAVENLARAIRSQDLKRANEKNKCDSLFGFRTIPETINSAILASDFELAYDLIRLHKGRFDSFGFRHEDFSTIEYKEMAENLKTYFNQIWPYFVRTTPMEALNQIREKELRLENEKKETKMRQEAERAELAARLKEKRERLNAKILNIFYWLCGLGLLASIIKRFF